MGGLIYSDVRVWGKKGDLELGYWMAPWTTTGRVRYYCMDARLGARGMGRGNLVRGGGGGTTEDGRDKTR